MINNNVGGSSSNVDEGNGATLDLPILVNIDVPQLSHLREIIIYDCDLLEYVFSFSTLKSLRQLEKLEIKDCMAMKEIVKREINGEQTTESCDGVVFPCLKSVELIGLPNLLGFFLGRNDFEWKSLEKVVISKCRQLKVFTSGHSTAPNLNFIHSSLGKHHITECGLNFHQISQETPWSYQNLVEIHLWLDHDVKTIIPSSELLQVKKLERIQVYFCKEVEEIFEGTNTVVEIPNLREVKLEDMYNLKYIWNNNRGMVLEFPNLTTLEISSCNSLKHVFTSSMVGSLLQLQHLQITYSENIEVIVKEEEEEEEESDGRVKQIELPRLKSITLDDLPSLKGFCLGKKEAFSFPSLDTLKIEKCPKLTVFTTGHSTTPELKRIKMRFGMWYLRESVMYDLKEDLNSFINTKLQEIPQETPCSYQNLVEIDFKYKHDVKTIIPSSELLQVKKLERIQVSHCDRVEEIFEGTNTVVEIPNLREVKLEYLYNLKYIWKNNRGMVLEFPNLTTLSIYLCSSLKHVFTSSMVGSLLQLQHLQIYGNEKLEVIVKEEEEEEESDGRVKQIELPRLMLISLSNVKNLKGFCLGKKEAFSFPSLDTLEIMYCRKLTVFTTGHSTTPELKRIKMRFGMYYLREEDLNSFINTKLQEGLKF